MTLIYNYKKDFIIESTAARTNIHKFVTHFQWFLEDNAVALREIKALWDHEAIAKLKSIVATSLVDSDPDTIVNWMLNIDSDPYLGYVEWQSSIWNKTLSEAMFAKNEDRYKNIMQDFFNDQTLKSKLWEYHFELDKIKHEAPLTNAYEVNVHHNNVFKPQITITATNQKQRVEEDVIWLEDFAQDIEPHYFTLDTHHLTADLAKEYDTYIQDDYVPFHHSQVVGDAGLYLWA